MPIPRWSSHIAWQCWLPLSSRKIFLSSFCLAIAFQELTSQSPLLPLLFCHRDTYWRIIYSGFLCWSFAPILYTGNFYPSQTCPCVNSRPACFSACLIFLLHCLTSILSLMWMTDLAPSSHLQRLSLSFPHLKWWASTHCKSESSLILLCPIHPRVQFLPVVASNYRFWGGNKVWIKKKKGYINILILNLLGHSEINASYLWPLQL